MDEICDNCNSKINIYDFKRNINDTNNITIDNEKY